MFKLLRTAVFFSMLPVAFLGPYFYSTGKWPEKLKTTYDSYFASSEKASDSGGLAADVNIAALSSESSATPNVAPPGQPQQPTAAPARQMRLQDALRFDISPQWVTQQWPEVTTLTSNLDFEGMRVPLLTGTTPADIAGALTYYFDKNQRVQRITLQGTTADPRPLMGLVQQRFGLKSHSTLEAGVMTSQWNRTITSALVVQRASVIRQDSPYAQYAFHLELNNPRLSYALSPEFAAQLKQRQNAKRW